MRKIITDQKSLFRIPVSGLMLATIIILLLAVTKTFSQTVAIGHVTAEVIESVSAASKAITSFDFTINTGNEAEPSNKSDRSAETFNLGVITLHSGKNINCNVVIKSASLSDTEGNGFIIEPAVKNNIFASTANANGSQTIQLDGKAKMSRIPVSGLYKGSYTVVIAYN